MATTAHQGRIWFGHGRTAAGLDRLIGLLAEPASRERTAVILLVAYGLIWTLYATIARSCHDIHFDMGEAMVWSREALLGTPKHPPLSAWPVGVWFRIFPHRDWAYYLLSMTLVTTALWAAWRIAVRMLSGDKLAVALVLLTLVPFYNFLGAKYNANTVMIPTWAFATWFFLRSYQTRQIGWAIAAGVAAAAVILAKYWGAFLLAAFAVAAVSDVRRAAYFRSAAPWTSIAAGLLALSPHLYWLASHTDTLGYALASHHSSAARGLADGPMYVVGAIAYVIVPLLLVGFAARVSPAMLRDMLVPQDPDRRMAVLILVLSVLLPVIAAPLARSSIVSLWTIGGATLLPVVLLSSPKIEMPRFMVRRILALALAFPVLAVAAAPAVALGLHVWSVRHGGLPNESEYYQLLAREIEQDWHSVAGTPLRLVGGPTQPINGIAFYAADGPSTRDIYVPAETPWADRARTARDGIAWVCPAPDGNCVQRIESQASGVPNAKRFDVTLRRDFLGIPGAPHGFVIIVVPPAAKAG